MITTVVNWRDDKNSCYIGRGSIFGNPYIIGRDGTRDEVIERYKNEWFPFLLKDKRFVAELIKLKNKKLGCFCKPYNRCHGEIIADYLNSLDSEQDEAIQ